MLLEEYQYSILGGEENVGGKTQKKHLKYLDDQNNTARNETTYIYDYAERLIEKQNHDDANSKECIEYYKNGLVKKETDARQNTTHYEYDSFNRPSKQWLPVETNKYIYKDIEYDRAGNIKQERTGKNYVDLYKLPASFAETTYTYYPNGNIKTITDNENRKREYFYDADGNLSKEAIYTDSNNATITDYENNHLGKPITQKQYVQKGDLAGNLFGDTTKETLITNYTYDKNGNVKTIKTPDQVTTSYKL